MLWNWIVLKIGAGLAILGLLSGLGGCLAAMGTSVHSNPETTLYSWLMFIGGSVLYGTSNIIEKLRPPEP